MVCGGALYPILVQVFFHHRLRFFHLRGQLSCLLPESLHSVSLTTNSFVSSLFLSLSRLACCLRLLFSQNLALFCLTFTFLPLDMV